jgi:hypothetical protein
MLRIEIVFALQNHTIPIRKKNNQINRENTKAVGYYGYECLLYMACARRLDVICLHRYVGQRSSRASVVVLHPRA